FYRTLANPNLALFAKVDGALMLGHGEQDVGLNFLGTPFDFRRSGPETVPYLNVQGGLSWTHSTNFGWGRLDAGSLYEQWWLHASGKDSNEALFPHINWLNHGPFVRMQVGF